MRRLQNKNAPEIHARNLEIAAEKKRIAAEKAEKKRLKEERDARIKKLSKDGHLYKHHGKIKFVLAALASILVAFFLVITLSQRGSGFSNFRLNNIIPTAVGTADEKEMIMNAEGEIDLSVLSSETLSNLEKLLAYSSYIGNKGSYSMVDSTSVPEMLMYAFYMTNTEHAILINDEEKDSVFRHVQYPMAEDDNVYKISVDYVESTIQTAFDIDLLINKEKYTTNATADISELRNTNYSLKGYVDQIFCSGGNYYYVNPKPMDINIHKDAIITAAERIGSSQIKISFVCYDVKRKITNNSIAQTLTQEHIDELKSMTRSEIDQDPFSTVTGEGTAILKIPQTVGQTEGVVPFMLVSFKMDHIW